MTSRKKSFPIIFTVIACVFALLAGIISYLPNSRMAVFAQTDEKSGLYYYDNLTTADQSGNVVEYVLAKKFYQALEKIEEAGSFKAGVVSYAINSIVTSDQIKGWVVDGKMEIPKAFSAARDSFLMDHPELFYVDLYKLTISASLTNGVYSAFIDSGRFANVYRDNSFKSETMVNKAIESFNTELNKMVNEVKTQVENNDSSVKTDLALAKAVNEKIATNVKYDFGAYNDYLNNKDGVSSASLTHTAYGALVLKKAVCSGYSFAYKAVLDKLDIPCVVVSGYSRGKDKNGNDTSGNVGHSWNYVALQTPKKEVQTSTRATNSEVQELETNWFAFDTTWNSVSTDKNKYTNMNAITAYQQHMPDGVISSAEYNLTYPSLSMVEYDQLWNPNNMDITVNYAGFSYSSIYGLSSAGNFYIGQEYVSFNGLNAKQLLEQQNLRLISRSYFLEDGEEKWSAWIDLASYSRFEGSGIQYVDNKTVTTFVSNQISSQYAVVSNISPDGDYVIGNDLLCDKCFYTDANLVEENAEFISIEFKNESYGTYTPAPYLMPEKTKPYAGGDVVITDNMSEPGNSNIMADSKALSLTLVYDEPLHILDETQPIKANFSADHENTKNFASFVPFPDGKYVHLVEDASGVPNTLLVKFKPSLMYEHNREGYMITFENVGSAKIVDKLIDNKLVRTTSDKAPNYVYFVFSRNYNACPNIFGDGRLWVNCCAQPTLVDNTDLSKMDFKDAEGNSTFSEQERSQMMLVVNNVSPKTEEDIINGIAKDKSNNISNKDIMASQTYDIDLQICGKYATIPDGSYVNIALGFPEGYGPDDEGVTFKIFHRKHISGDKYIIEEIPCVVTKFGIVATVNSFSPYTVVAVSEKKATEKTIVASIEGKGGKLSKEDSKIRTIGKNSQYTYTIAPDEGYQIYSVTLNGKNITNKVTSNQLTLSYDELTRNNELEIKYISNDSAVRYSELNIVEPVKVVMSTNNTFSQYSFVEGEVFSKNSNVGIVVGVFFGALAIILAVVIARVVIMKKKRANNENN